MVKTADRTAPRGRLGVVSALRLSLGRRRPDDELGAIVDVLTSGEETTERRCTAAEALSRWDEPRAVEALVTTLESGEPALCASAARGLAILRDPAAADQLVAAVARWGDPGYADARRAGLDALLALREDRLPLRLALALVEGDEQSELGDDERELLRALLAVEAPASTGEATAQLLVERLEDERSPVANRAADLLPVVAAESLLPLISRVGAAVPATPGVVAALAATGDGRAVAPLVSLLSSPDAGLRASAAHGLGRLGDPLSVEPLVARADDPHPDVRAAVAVALAALGLPPGVHARVEAHAQEGNDLGTARRRGLAEGLRHLAMRATAALRRRLERKHQGPRTVV